MSPEVVSAVRSQATKLKIPLPNALAPFSVESSGTEFATVDGKELPLIRFEGHYFYARVKPELRAQAIKQGLASPRAGGIKNPTSQQARWDKLLKPAIALDKHAAYESISVGMAQVMGAHWERLGYASAEDLFDQCAASVAGQVDIFFRYVKEFGLVPKLQAGDFAGFARGYNGANYKANSYDTKMAKAAKQFAAQYGQGTAVEMSTGAIVTRAVAKDAEAAQTMLRLGTKGAKVRELQALLKRAGYAVNVDGDFGPSTEDAVKELQRAQGWKGKLVDGMVGPMTWQIIDRYRVDPAEQPGQVTALSAMSQTDEGTQGAVAAGSGVGLITAKEAVQSATDQLSGSVGNGGALDKIYLALTVIGALLAVAGIAWVAYGYVKSRKTQGVKEA